MPNAVWRRAAARLALVVLPAMLVAGLPIPRFVVAGGISPLTTTLAYPSPPVLASAAAMLDVDTGAWLYLANPDQPLPMASTTKIMTAVLAIEHGHLDDLARVSASAASIGGTSMGLAAGERVRMRDLLYGLLLPSGNDAAAVIAEHIAGSMAAFARLMNAKAAALHLQHTHYLNSYGFFDTPDGDAAPHYASARDLVLLARYAMSLPLFRQIVGTEQYVAPATTHNREHDLTNINKVLFWYPGADGVKPGWTSGAGLCQVVDVHRDGRHLILAVLHTANLFTDVRDLLNYALGDFRWIGSGQSGDVVDQYVDGGQPGDRARYYPYTGHSVHGAFLPYFLAHGGLQVFGFPRTEAIGLQGVTAQFFTNQVLTYDAHGALTPLRLGIGAVPSPGWLARVPPVGNTAWRTYYPQTGHTVTYRFRDFYLAEGGPRTFGYPISEKRNQGSLLVQYFENTEFIWHPTSPTAGYIAIAPLGEQYLARLGLAAPPGPATAHLAPLATATGSVPSPTPTSSPTSGAGSSPAASATSTPTSALPSPTATPSGAQPSLTGTPPGTPETDTPVPAGTPVG